MKEEFPKDICGTACLPASESFFDVRLDYEQKVLEEDREVAFDHMVPQLLLVQIDSKDTCIRSGLFD